MKKVIKLNENDLELLVKKIIKEDSRQRGGTLYGGKAEIVDEVINRIGEYGEEYVRAIEELNSKFPSTKYRRIENPREPQIPSGVRLRSTVYPNR